jgi:hypothetical protein
MQCYSSMTGISCSMQYIAWSGQACVSPKLVCLHSCNIGFQGMCFEQTSVAHRCCVSVAETAGAQCSKGSADGISAEFDQCRTSAEANTLHGYRDNGASAAASAESVVGLSSGSVDGPLHNLKHQAYHINAV